MCRSDAAPVSQWEVPGYDLARRQRARRLRPSYTVDVTLSLAYKKYPSVITREADKRLLTQAQTHTKAF